MRLSVVLVSMCFTGTAAADAPKAAPKPAAKLIDGAKASPPRFVDESTTSIALRNTNKADSKGGYTIDLHAVVGNVSTAKGNEYKLLWTSKGKTVATVACTFDRTLEDGDRMLRYGTTKAGAVDCNDNALDLNAAGPIEAQLVMTDADDGNQYLLRTYKVTVLHPKSFGDPVWAILPDDTLGAAWIAGNHDNADHLELRFWIAGPSTNKPDIGHCTVDGKKAPDLEFGGAGNDTDLEYIVRKQDADEKKYAWARVEMSTDKHISAAPGMPAKGADPKQFTAFGQYPGKWECDLLKGDKVTRKVSFTINARGFVDPSPSQAGELTLPDVMPIDIKFGKDATDMRVRPDAIKKSGGWGRPWPKAAPSDLPKASGLPDPK